MTSGFENDYPGNSHKSKEVPAVEEKHITPVTQGVVRRKPGLGSRFSSLFITENPRDAFERAILERFVPGLRDSIVELLVDTVEKSLSPGAGNVVRGASNAYRRGSTSTPGYVTYNKFSGARKPSNENPRAGISSRARATHNFDDILMDSRIEANEVLSGLFDVLTKYEVATVADYYELVGETGSFTDTMWGWIDIMDIRDAEIVRTRGGKYQLRLPRPVSLKE